MAPVSAATARNFSPRRREDARIGVVHVAVFALQVRVVRVEGIGVLHHEFARAHDAEARPDLVAELGLDLVEVERQLAVGADFPARDVGDDFFVGRAETEIALVPVLDLEHLRAELSQRPVSCHSSAGCTAGISSSTAPARFISSRTMFSTLRSTRRPSGIQV